MTVSDQANTPEPAHSIGMLTTSELSEYRKLLERAIGDRTIGNAPVAETLKAKLQRVIDEEIEREQHRHSGHRWPLHN